MLLPSENILKLYAESNEKSIQNNPHPFTLFHLTWLFFKLKKKIDFGFQSSCRVTVESVKVTDFSHNPYPPPHNLSH